MHGKGVEQFLSFARILKAADPAFDVRLIGAIPAGAEQFASALISDAKALGITLHISVAADEVARILKQTTFAYLPFPDAATERRGSLLAAMLNGVRVLAPVGQQTPDWIRAAITDAATPEAAAATLLAASQPSASAAPPPSPEVSWSGIAHRHKTLYETLIRARNTRKAA